MNYAEIRAEYLRVYATAPDPHRKPGCRYWRRFEFKREWKLLALKERAIMLAVQIDRKEEFRLEIERRIAAKRAERTQAAPKAP